MLVLQMSEARDLVSLEDVKIKTELQECVYANQLVWYPADVFADRNRGTVLPKFKSKDVRFQL